MKSVEATISVDATQSRRAEIYEAKNRARLKRMSFLAAILLMFLGFQTAGPANAAHNRPKAVIEYSMHPTPTIRGESSVGSWLTVVPGKWPAGVKLSFQWKRNWKEIKGQTKTRYLVTKADLGRTITVWVTGTKRGYMTYECGSAEFRITSASSTASPSPAPTVLPSPTPSPNGQLGKLLSTPLPTITGNPIVGSELQANPGRWDTGVQFNFQWLRGADPIVGATASKYVVTDSDVGAIVRVVVTGWKANFVSVSRTSSATSPVTRASTPLQEILQYSNPKVSGTAQVGQTLFADTGTWSSGVSLALQWLKDGLPIQGATSATYRVAPADLAAKISLNVTGSKSGHKSLTLVSPLTVAVTSANFTELGIPNIGGTAAVGNTLTLSMGVWDKEAKLSIEWLVDGVVVAGQTSSSFTIRLADLGKRVSARVTAMATGYRTESKDVALAEPVTEGLLGSAPTPVISGTASLGSVLTASPGPWTSGILLAYQWNRNGVPIAGATRTTYQLVVADIGAVISVSVSGSKAGFQTMIKTGIFAGQIPSPDFPSTPSPQIILQTNRTYILYPTLDWGPDATFAYQWMRNGVPISGATGTSYTVDADDSGQRLSLAATGSKPGAKSVTKLSGALTVPPLKFSTFGMTISWSRLFNAVGSDVSAVPTLEPGVTVAYQWLRDGVPILGETKSWYHVVTADALHYIGFTFTATKPGYETRTGTIEQKVGDVIRLAPKPIITGDAHYFSKLTANAGVWDAGVSLRYEWYSDFDGNGVGSQFAPKWLLNETTSYTGVQTANGRYFQVCVTGTKANAPAVRVCSDYFGPMQNNLFPAQPKPTIVGNPATDSALTADVSGWLAGTTFRYRWIIRADGVTKSSFNEPSLNMSKVGTYYGARRTIQLELTASKDGYESVTVTSDEIPG